jgi:membrane protease YdiL (CAAX protease family)
VAYQRTQRIEAAIIVHIALNAVHFIGFTYPYAAR